MTTVRDDVNIKVNVGQHTDTGTDTDLDIGDDIDDQTGKTTGQSSGETTSEDPAADIDVDPATTFHAFDDLVQQRVRMRLGVRRAWLGSLTADGHRDAEIAVGDLDRVEDELAWRSTQVPADLVEAIAHADATLGPDGGWHGASLAHTFGLDDAEFDLVQVLYAAAIDDRLRRSIAGSAGRETVDVATALRLCDRHGVGLDPESPLARWRIVHTDSVGGGEPDAVWLDPSIVRWLAGAESLDEELAAIAKRGVVQPALESWPIATVVERCAVGDGMIDPCRITVRGRVGSGRRSFAVAAADAIGLSALVIEPAAPLSAAAAVAARRYGFLSRSAPVWVDAEPPGEMTFPIEFVCLGPGSPAVVNRHRVGVDIVIDLPPLSGADRRRLWQHSVAASERWPAAARDDIVQRPQVTVGDIAAVGRSGLVDPAAVAAALNESQRAGLGDLLAPVPLPYRSADLIIPERTRAALDFLLFEVRQRRSADTDQRLLPNRGVVALLAGPPGVGKTMTAQVIAAELGLDLLRVNLAETISKYVGETSKNLAAVLDQAADLDAVLLFDEADSLFGKRTELRDAHDRYANADTNFLLQRIESHPGLALLATNRRDHLDVAFTRRLRHVIELPTPDAEARRRLWHLFADELIGDLPAAAAELIDRFAERCELTGADIKHAVHNACLIGTQRGGAVDDACLLAGLDCELTKQGRPLSDLEQERIRHG